MSVARGDVVIISFPQQGSSPKRRPALVVQSDHNNARLSNSIFAMITSNTRLATVEPAQVLIDISTPDGQQSGLAQNSTVKCENLYTLPQHAVAKMIGKLPNNLMALVDDALKSSLAVS
ncbi:MAG: type II toxin-antitoxin system PemK/MazF family toxin [Pirellulaceae bacterium]|jgi:mRNA-degrading endonuclease toxin of MazEF toxin-antitoxin module|nr:type II toxin-antitoxin system PemK/MazF family toxin [Pirellulaceae bacterium]MDP7019261.1 type II toxin-antitoxin system PemK/MazF family toxin [Pirellulaceae bacterium]